MAAAQVGGSKTRVNAVDVRMAYFACADLKMEQLLVGLIGGSGLYACIYCIMHLLHNCACRCGSVCTRLPRLLSSVPYAVDARVQPTAPDRPDKQLLHLQVCARKVRHAHVNPVDAHVRGQALLPARP